MKKYEIEVKLFGPLKRVVGEYPWDLLKEAGDEVVIKAVGLNVGSAQKSVYAYAKRNRFRVATCRGIGQSLHAIHMGVLPKAVAGTPPPPPGAQVIPLAPAGTAPSTPPTDKGPSDFPPPTPVTCGAEPDLAKNAILEDIPFVRGKPPEAVPPQSETAPPPPQTAPPEHFNKPVWADDDDPPTSDSSGAPDEPEI